MPESDEALLRRAAQTVRFRAKLATRGPWEWRTSWCDSAPGEADHPNCEGVDTLAHWPPLVEMTHESNVLKVSHSDWAPHRDDKAWIALVSPALAEPLAAWLELAAESAAYRALHGNGAPGEAARTAAALNLARALLGEAPTASEEEV